ncbi:hypothetical protein KKB18_13820, partial [bacterium]|nr:hypothetical protein [bacterium]
SSFIKYCTFLYEMIEASPSKEGEKKDILNEKLQSFLDFLRKPLERMKKELAHLPLVSSLKEIVITIWNIYDCKHRMRSYEIFLHEFENSKIITQMQILNNLIKDTSNLLKEVSVLRDSLFLIFYNLSQVYSYAGNIMYLMGKYEIALQFYEKENKRIPNQIPLLEKIARTYSRIGNK